MSASVPGLTHGAYRILVDSMARREAIRNHRDVGLTGHDLRLWRERYKCARARGFETYLHHWIKGVQKIEGRVRIAWEASGTLASIATRTTVATSTTGTDRIVERAYEGCVDVAGWTCNVPEARTEELVCNHLHTSRQWPRTALFITVVQCT